MGAEQSKEHDKSQLKGMVMCGRNVNCGGCMDTDPKLRNAPMDDNGLLDGNGQLSKPMQLDVKEMVKN